MSCKKGDVYVTSVGRKYQVVCGPFKDNAGVRYLVLDVDDNRHELISSGLLHAFEGERKNEQF